MNFFHPFSLMGSHPSMTQACLGRPIKLLFSHGVKPQAQWVHRTSFLRYPYLIESYWRIGTEHTMHSTLHCYLSFQCTFEGLTAGTLSYSCVKLSGSPFEITVWHVGAPAGALGSLCDPLTGDKLLYILFHWSKLDGDA